MDIAGWPVVSPAKCTRPRVSASFLPRPRLTRVLDRAAPGQVVVVCAPAGFGKTQLLADWLADRAGAWVTLDADDDVDGRFWAALLAALDGVPGADRTPWALPRPATPSRDPAFVASVVDALAAAGPITLVLDDVHAVSAPDPLHGLAALVRYRPANLLLVLATRSDATLRLDRLRLGEEVVDLRAGDLAFTRDETSALLAASGVPVSPDRLDLLCAQTEGWAAALAFAARSLAGSTDPDALLRDLAGHPHLADYLTGEILARLPADVADVLATVSVCDEVTAPLAAVLAERADAGDVLAELERTTALVTGSGAARGAFQVHPLLRAQLRADLRRRRPDRFAALHGRVARARQEHGDVVGALHHAALADDAVLLGELLDVHGPALASGGHHAAVLAALDALPVADVSARPRLLLIAALAHAEVGRRAVAHRLLTRADTVWPADPDPGLAALRARARARLGRIGPSGGDPPDPRAEPGAGTAVVDVLLRVDHALAAGRWDEAESLARAAGAEAARQGNTYLEARAVVTLGVVRSLRGDVTGSVALARRAAEIAPSRPLAGHRRRRVRLLAAGLRRAAAVPVRGVPALGRGGGPGDGRPPRSPGTRRGGVRAGRPARGGPVRPRRAPRRPRGPHRGAGGGRRRPAARTPDARVRRRRRARGGSRARHARPRPHGRRVGPRPPGRHR